MGTLPARVPKYLFVKFGRFVFVIKISVPSGRSVFVLIQLV